MLLFYFGMPKVHKKISKENVLDDECDVPRVL